MRYRRTSKLIITNNSTSADSQNLSSLWTLTYSPHQSSAFRLRNNLQDCYLATSYRSFPDWDAIHGNDTVLQGLRMELEVTCSTEVTFAASTFDIVDGLRAYSFVTVMLYLISIIGYREFGLISKQNPYLSNLIESVKKNIIYQFEVVMATLSL